MQSIQIEDGSGYTEVAHAFFNCGTVDVYDISICMYRLYSNVEDHSNVDTSNTLSEGHIMAAEGQLVIGIWKRALLVLEIRRAVLGLLCSLRKFQFLLLASHIRSMLAMSRIHTIDVLPLKAF